MKTIHDVEVKGKKVLLRADFNVPMDAEKNITDDIRMRMVLPTITLLIEKGAKLIICSHCGRPDGERNMEFSLAPIAAHLQTLTGMKVILAEDCIGEAAEKAIHAAADKEIVLLENLRFYSGETENDPEFSRQLASLAEVYVNDAFAVSHRAHASVVGVPQLMSEKAAGLLLQKEIDYFRKSMGEPVRPLVAVVGGAKVSSKLGALTNMLDKVNKMIVGGAMANTFLKSMGINVGASKVEDDLLETAKKFVEDAAARGVKLYFPVDFVVADKFENDAVHINVTFRDIPEGWMALDIGPASSILFREALADARTIIWNGPMGAFEMDSFARGTMAVCQDIASSHALSIVGGGDSNAAVKKAGEEQNISYMSTGGGAFLYMMEGKVLPGVTALS
ncbi:phosphoglycerate kinase [Desulforhopalus vacuolatus]|uniref:phosphoglycerate kinase n=1 Tax=Desulforhopalus vacuolatus TaxID=40414 RepID=UPI001962A9F8|nr:phosphoglycerate kinase [Desulforhopalus vacuolatus]MBM9518393.1 phosphoglycerate kinase [Desulforhopalus vacuolatus]